MAIRELLDCLPFTTTDDQLEALNKLVGYYRTNDKRMRYSEFREQQGLPIGSGIVESAHKHVLQVRMKQAGQRWSILRARRMVQLRALYRTAGPRRFHWAIREALRVPPARPHIQVENAPRRVKHDELEISFPDPTVARQAIELAIQKLPIKARFIAREEAF